MTEELLSLIKPLYLLVKDMEHNKQLCHLVTKGDVFCMLQWNLSSAISCCLSQGLQHILLGCRLQRKHRLSVSVLAVVAVNMSYTNSVTDTNMNTASLVCSSGNWFGDTEQIWVLTDHILTAIDLRSFTQLQMDVGVPSCCVLLLMQSLHDIESVISLQGKDQ